LHSCIGHEFQSCPIADTDQSEWILKTMAIGNFEDLLVWQKSVKFAVDVYATCENLPESERYGIRSQLTRAAISISSNIAEGHGRKSPADFIRFLRISMGSCRECQSLVMVAKELGMFDDSVMELQESAAELSRMLNGLISRLEAQKGKA